MKTIKYIFTLCVLIALLSASCDRQADQLPMVEVNGTEIPDLDPNLLTPIDIKLSQIAENFNFVALETDSNCLLSSDVVFQVGKKYIIAQDRQGVTQFSMDGSFIRKLVSYGRGPGEALPSHQSCFVESEDLFIVISKFMDISYYSLSTGEFLGSKGRPILKDKDTMGSCVYLGDSIILFSHTTNGLVNAEDMGSGVTIQTLGGDVLWQKDFNYNSMVVLSPNYKFRTGSRIFLLATNDPDEYVLQVEDQDTIYKLNTLNHSLVPTMVRRIENSEVDGYPVSMYADNCTVEMEEYARVNGCQLINYIYVEELDFSLPSLVVSGNRFYILYDDNQKVAYRIKTFENDYFGFKHETDGDTKYSPNYFPALLRPYGKLVETYDAFSFLQFAGKALTNPDLDPTVRTRLLDITGKVTETSNPVLLIGDMKKKIDL